MKTLHVKTKGYMFTIGRKTLRSPFKIKVNERDLRVFEVKASMSQDVEYEVIDESLSNNSSPSVIILSSENDNDTESNHQIDLGTELFSGQLNPHGSPISISNSYTKMESQEEQDAYIEEVKDEFHKINELNLNKSDSEKISTKKSEVVEDLPIYEVMDDGVAMLGLEKEDIPVTVEDGYIMTPFNKVKLIRYEVHRNGMDLLAYYNMANGEEDYYQLGNADLTEDQIKMRDKLLKEKKAKILKGHVVSSRGKFKITRYELSSDKKGLNAFFDDDRSYNGESYYHIHSDELTKTQIKKRDKLLKDRDKIFKKKKQTLLESYMEDE